MSRRKQTTSPAVGLVCDLAKGRTYSPFMDELPVPILSAFGSSSLHECHWSGEWDFERAVVDNPHAVIRSRRFLEAKNNDVVWSNVLFEFDGLSFLYCERSAIVAYAISYEKAANILKKFTGVYGITCSKMGGQYQLIQVDKNVGIMCLNVDLEPQTLLTDELFALHYPEGTDVWHEEFVAKIVVRKSGLTILEGQPGTGKTSYLRHLMGKLKESHRFYFIPPSNIGILSEPTFIGFWAGEQETHSKYKLVVIIEDADAALMSRGADNRDQVSSILNLSDGMLADFLRLNIICTINCRADDIDQAFLRPGRLLSHRVFERLDPSQAARLAASLGKELPHAQDYSLAEVFAGHQSEVPHRPHIGFGGK